MAPLVPMSSGAPFKREPFSIRPRPALCQTVRWTRFPGWSTPAGSDGYVRDPFSSACGPNSKIITLAACSDLNQLNAANAARIDQNAVNVLNLFPAPNSGLQTYGNSPALFEHRNQFDIRGDCEPGTRKIRSSSASAIRTTRSSFPGIFGGIADGGSFDQGLQTAKSDQAVAGYTHVFTPNTVNQVRAGFAHLHTTRFGPEATVNGIPGQYGIPSNGGIPQGQENGGLPAFGIGNLAQLGSNSFLPSDEVSQTLQVTDDFTKIYGKHSFKMGIEYQNVKFSTLQPAWSHGQFNYGGGFTDIPNLGQTTGGVAQMILPPAPFSAGNGAYTSANDPNGFSWSGGSDQTYASNINKTYDQKVYFATYFQDDWKMTPKLTLNLGVRWDYFGPINETNGGQANFVPFPVAGSPIGAPTFIIPAIGQGQPGSVHTPPIASPCWPAAPGSSTCLLRMASPCFRPTGGARGCCRHKKPTSRLASASPTR